MPLARTGVLVGLLIGLVAVTLQNQSPALAVVFLGMRSQPLPLGIWIVGAVALGIFMGLLLLFLLNITSTGTRPAVRRPRTAHRPSPNRSTASTSPTAIPDWDTPVSNDWGSGDSSSDWGAQPAKPPAPPKPNLDDFSSVDEQRYARAGGAAPSTYSRSAKDPTFARQPGQKESVFEAEYRMVKPPGQQEPPASQNWDELDDDFFEED